MKKHFLFFVKHTKQAKAADNKVFNINILFFVLTKASPRILIQKQEENKIKNYKTTTNVIHSTISPHPERYLHVQLIAIDYENTFFSTYKTSKKAKEALSHTRKNPIRKLCS